MTPGERFKKWVDDFAVSIKDRLRGWMAGWVENGLKTFIKGYEPEIISATRETLEKLKTTPNIPPEISNLIDKALTTGDIFSVVGGWLFSLLGIIPAVMSRGAPMGRRWEYWEDRLNLSFRLDPISVIAAWRRDPSKYETYFDDLRDLGWSEDRIEALKKITEIIPGVSDLIRMSVREAFSPEIAEKFGQYQDPPTAVYPWAEKLGLSKDWVDRYWAAHWELPSAGQGFELLHRGILTEDDLKLLLRALDVMPYWRDKLIKASWNVPTRVDVRRFWDLRTIDEARLREVYTALGYHGKDLEDYVLWTKIYVDFPDLLARYKNGWITIDQVKSELIAMGMDPSRAETLIQEKMKNAMMERTVTEKNLTRADIISGIKKGVITRAEGEELLVDLGYDAAEGAYILAVNIPPDEEEKVAAARQLSKADILSGLKTAVITQAQARDKLLELRYQPSDVEFLLSIYDAQVKPPVETKLKEAAKADILLGVKKGLITPEEGYGMLLDLDFNPDAANFILMVHAEESPFSPINYPEFKDMTQKWRKASGLESKPVTEELKKQAAEVVRLSAEVDSLKRSVEEEKRGLVEEEALPEAATARLKKLRVTLHRAESALAHAKLEYDRLIAEWRHGVSE